MRRGIYQTTEDETDDKEMAEYARTFLTLKFAGRFSDFSVRRGFNNTYYIIASSATAGRWAPIGLNCKTKLEAWHSAMLDDSPYGGENNE